jgi:methionyl-tRNA synthetase
VLPDRDQRNVLITAALPYVNNVPHLGNIIGCVLSADVYARYCRSRGYRTLYVGGTDEYGTATEFKAVQEGLTPREVCDKYHAAHKDIYKWFAISFDQFGRTSTSKQTEVVQSIFKKIRANGWLKEQEGEQFYSEELGKFLADRYVEGTCPKCHAKDARGDQCDSCRAQLDATELLEPRCKLTGIPPVLRPTKHLHLDLPGLEARLRLFHAWKAWKSAHAIRGSVGSEKIHGGGWSTNARSETAARLRNGLQARCITRDLQWGVPVPHAGFEDKVFYVWFDAPIGYISITAAYTPEWERWWRAPEDVKLVQFLGKDNTLFHTLNFPASLLATGERWTLLDRISVTDYLTYEGSKFSKGRGIGVFGDQACSTGLPSDVFRYYLLSVRPESGNDADFSWADLRAKNNGDLVNNLGNLCHRVLDFIGKRCDGTVPRVAASNAGVEDCLAFGEELKKLVDQYIDHFENTRLREALKVALLVSSKANVFIQEQQPWKRLATHPEEAAACLAASAGVVRLLAALLAPFLPTVASLLLRFLGLPAEYGCLSDTLFAGVCCPHQLVPAGHKLGPQSQPLFDEISEEQINEFRARFSGQSADGGN